MALDSGYFPHSYFGASYFPAVWFAPALIDEVEEERPAGGFPEQSKPSFNQPKNGRFLAPNYGQPEKPVEEVKQEIERVEAKKQDAEPESIDYWGLHALEQMLALELVEMMRQESERLAQIAISRARQKERDLAFVMAMMI